VAYDFLLSSRTLSNGRTAHYARLAGTNQPEFLIGFRTSYKNNYGLFNPLKTNGVVYDPIDFFEDKGFWAHFIYPTAKAESNGSFYCLNTYDRARFTFGFMQFAAHVPNGDFVKWFKTLMTLPNARDYFPKISLQDGRLYYSNGRSAPYALEDDSCTELLMKYLNPSLSEIENQELICSARMVHWALYDPDHRKCQVDTTLELWKQNMAYYHTRFNLDGTPASVCQLICDILHQGRGDYNQIAAAINTNKDWKKAFSNLLLIGDPGFRSRIDTVKNTIATLVRTKIFNTSYDSTTNSFV